MIMDPYELRMLSREMDSPTCEAFELRLKVLHNSHMLHNNNLLLIPKFWCETVFVGFQEMIKEYPNLKFGSVIETKARLRVYTVPSTGSLETMKLKLYNKIDTLVLETIDRLLKGDKKPFFMT